MLQFPLTQANFPATEKDNTSLISMTSYKSVVGRSSNWSCNAAKPFSFKLPEGAAFVKSASNSTAFRNGLILDVEAGENDVVDFCEDLNYIYSAVFVKVSVGSYAVRLLKVLKSEMLNASPSYTQVQLASGSTMYALYSNYNRAICQNDDYVFAVLDDSANTSKARVMKIAKSNLALTTIEISTAALTNFQPVDICCDSETLYVAYRITLSGTESSNLWSFNISTFASREDTASLPMSYRVSSLCVLDENVIAATGFFDDNVTVYSSVIKRNTSTLDLEPITPLMVGWESNGSGFVSMSSDRNYNNSKVFARVTEFYGGHETHLKKLMYAKGITKSSSPVGTDPVINTLKSINSAYDFNISLVFNYGVAAANSQVIFKASNGEVDFEILMDDSSNIIVKYNGIELARGTAAIFKSLYGTAQKYQTVMISISRTKSANPEFYMDVNGESCSVIQHPVNFNKMIDMPRDISIELGTSTNIDMVYRSIFASFGGNVIINDDYSNGKVPVGGIDFVSIDSLYDMYESTAAQYSKRIEAKGGNIYCNASPDSSHIKIAKYNYFLDSPIISDDLDGFGSSFDEVVRVLLSDDGFVYFLSGMEYISTLRTYNISRMIVLNIFGSDRFSFSCNAKELELLFSPTSTGYHYDNLNIYDKNNANLQSFFMQGTSHTADSTYTTKSAIIKMGEGHQDFLRQAQAPNVVSIDFYRKAEAGYAGTKYYYDSYNANFVVSASGTFKKVPVSVNLQDTGEVYGSWLDTVNIYFEPGALARTSPVAVVAVMGASAFKAELFYSLDSNYDMNDESNIVSLGDANDTALLSNSSPAISGRKQIEVIEMIGLDNRNAKCIKFRIGTVTDSAKYDDFKIFELRYSPADTFYIGGDNES